MNIPTVYEFILLGLAAWSVFHLVAFDDLLDRPRRKLLRLGDDWEREGDQVPSDYRLSLALFLTCPYCAGMWIWGAWIVAWWIWPDGVLPIAVLFGGRALVVAGQKLLGKEEDKTVSKNAEAISDGLFALARKQGIRKNS